MTINFILVAIDQIVNHASKIHYMFGGQARVPLVIRTPSGGVGQLAATHSQSFENWFAYCPGLKVVAPATPYDVKGLMRSAIRDDDPVIFIESLALYDTKGEVPQDDDYTLPIGTAEVKRGADITVVSYTRMTVIALLGLARRSPQPSRSRRSITSMRRFSALRGSRFRCHMPPNYRKHPSLARRI